MSPIGERESRTGAPESWDSDDAQGNGCFYCGLTAATLDHVVPRIILRTAELSGDDELVKYFKGRRRVMIVDACFECNSLIGAKYFHTLEERRRFLKGRLLKRYARYLKLPNWSEAELLDVSPTLEEKIRGGIALRDLTRERLAYEGPATVRGELVAAA